METLKISSDEIGYITAFETSTGASVKYCMTNNGGNKILFVVKKGDMGLAVGKKGSNVQKARKKLGKNIELVEYSDDPVEFVRNMFSMCRVSGASLSDKVVRVEMDERDKMLAIGMNGKNLQKAKTLAKRLHDIDNIIIV